MSCVHKELYEATAQPCVARKQPIGVLPTTFENGFDCFAGFVTIKTNNHHG